MSLTRFLQTVERTTAKEEGTLGQIIDGLSKGVDIKISSKSILFFYPNGEKKNLVISKSSRGFQPQRDWVLISFTHETLGEMSRICKPADLQDGNYLRG